MLRTIRRYWYIDKPKSFLHCVASWVLLWGQNLRKLAFHFYIKSRIWDSAWLRLNLVSVPELMSSFVIIYLTFSLLICTDLKPTLISKIRNKDLKTTIPFQKSFDTHCEVRVVSGAFVNLHLPSLPFPPFTYIVQSSALLANLPGLQPASPFNL